MSALIAIIASPPPLAASIPSTLDPAVIGAGAQTASGSISSTVASGRPPYTYQWNKVSGLGGIVGSTTSSSATVEYTANTPFSQVGVFDCDITDAIGRSVNTNDCTVTFTGETA